MKLAFLIIRVPDYTRWVKIYDDHDSFSAETENLILKIFNAIKSLLFLLELAKFNKNYNHFNNLV